MKISLSARSAVAALERRRGFDERGGAMGGEAQPGAVLPFHKHPEIEQSWVLQGSFYDHDGICRAGQFVWRTPGSLHETKSDEGCLLLAIYRKPNIFYRSAGFQSKAK